ncbi:MAG: DUF4349 domain-containing protein [Terriglobales bacterium]|jgi:hypothetical protein
MVVRWGVFSTKSRKALKTGWLVAAGLAALYLAVNQPHNQERGIAMQKASGLASMSEGVGWEPTSLWHQTSILPHFVRTSIAKGIVGGVPVDRAAVLSASLIASPGTSSGGEQDGSSPDRQLVRTASVGLIVKAPAQTAEQITQLAQRAGGFLVTSNVNGGADATNAALTIRVPAAKFDEVRIQIRKLGLRVGNESIEAQDVTRQYVDQKARLRNLRAEEQQYLGILRKVATVKDTLEVSDKLNEVRGAIEERQAEFEALSKQVETVAINVNLQAEADAQVFGLNWRPLYRLKIAAREGLGGLADYAASMTAFVFYLPTLLLWLFTILAGAAIGWRILRWAGEAFFGFAPKAVHEQQV